MSQERKSLVTSEVDFETRGMQRGVIRIPYSHNRSAYGFIPIPLWTCSGGVGPTVLLTGANHGDEYESPVALMRLLHEGAFENLSGRVIVIPGLNFPAYRAGTRISPIDHVNLNRAFPGKRDGTVTEMLAHYIETELLPLADYVLDIHSGGSSLNYLPTLISYEPRSDDERKKLDLIVDAFNAPRHMRMELLVEDRVIGAGAHRNGAVFVSGEFGGGASVSPQGVEIVVSGIKGVMAALGMVPNRQTSSLVKTQRMRVIPGEHYLYAPRMGVFEPVFVLGDTVSKGQLAGRLYDQEQPWREPLELRFDGSGLVVCVRTFALVQPGDCLVHLAEIIG